MYIQILTTRRNYGNDFESACYGYIYTIQARIESCKVRNFVIKHTLSHFLFKSKYI